MIQVPILLITFNRPGHTKKVLEAILAGSPQNLYIFQDGPREGNDGDKRRSAEVKQAVEDLTRGSSAHVHTYFAERNLGCGAGPATAINWFFSHVEMGIVLEDDCLPHPDFFGYCEELLVRYKDNDRVRFINATLYDDRWQCEASYGFSRYMVTGAWAGWKRTLLGFDLELKSLDAKAFRQQVLQLTGNRGEANWWYSIAMEIRHDGRKKSYWDYQMQINLFRSGALTIHPKVNLVSNIGFDGEGTHTLNNADKRGDRATYPILPLFHPDCQVVDKARDAKCWAKAQSHGLIQDSWEYLYQTLLWTDGLGHKVLMAYKRLKGTGVSSRKV